MDEESSDPIRVLRIIARTNIGGPSIQIFGLLNKMPQTRFNQLLVTGFCADGEMDYFLVNQLEIRRIQIAEFGRGIGLKSDLISFLKIRKLMKEFKPHIVHTHTAKAGFLGRLASLSLKRQHIRVHTFHGHLLHGYFNHFLTQSYIVLEKIFAKFTDAIVAVGEQVRLDLINAGIANESKIYSFPAGIPSLMRDQSNFVVAKEPHSHIKIAWVGRFVPIKAPHRILEISRACKTLNLLHEIKVLGDGPLLAKVKKIAQEEGLPITFFGWQPNVIPILSSCDFIVSTSLNEGTPVALIQAQMLGIPGIATNVGSTTEVIIHEKGGFCENYDPNLFALRILKLSQDPILYQEFSNFSRNYSESHFSLERLVSDHTSLYTKMLNGANSLPIAQA